MNADKGYRAFDHDKITVFFQGWITSERRDKIMKLVVIGGDAAGMSNANRAKRNRSEMKLTILEQTGDVSHSACGMLII
jgi:hypothetical protein